MSKSRLCSTAAVCLLIAACLTGRTLGAGDWAYSGNHGVGYWAKAYPRYCDGDKQSPIDLKSQESTHDPLIKKYVFNQTSKGSVNLTLKNDGHKVELSWSPGLSITMGLTKQMYTAAQLHWHWGKDDTKGSEHTVNSKSFPAEGHLVFYNFKGYDNLSHAMDKPSGLAVLGVFYELSTTENPLFSILNETLSELTSTNSSTIVAPKNFDLIKTFLPSNTDDFYRYEGSLTTPNCYESVLWTVYRQPVPITASQLSLLRRLKFTNGSAMVDNFRPPLALNPRTQPGTPRTLYRTFSSANHVLPAGLSLALLTATTALMRASGVRI